MSDDDILARGGTQEDIDRYAERNGAITDVLDMKEELKQAIDTAISSGLNFASRTEWNPQAVKDYDDMLNSVMQIVWSERVSAKIEAYDDISNVLKEDLKSVGRVMKDLYVKLDVGEKCA